MRTARSARMIRASTGVGSSNCNSASAEADQAQGAAAKQAAAFPFVAERVATAAAAVRAGLDVARVDPHRDTMGDVLGFLLASPERRFDIARAQAPIAADIDRGSS